MVRRASLKEKIEIVSLKLGANQAQLVFFGLYINDDEEKVDESHDYEDADGNPVDNPASDVEDGDREVLYDRGIWQRIELQFEQEDDEMPEDVWDDDGGDKKSDCESGMR
ncbi:hypothetical protein B7494_g3592 [Chlorociboria aeruginascens]|nr:hypothetical protein B7494_g3592 [Chlorociboria aeruginascens]